MPFRACTIRWRKPHADNLLEDECLWHQCSTWRISESNDENLRGLEGIMMTALKKQQLAMTRNCLPCESEADGRMLNLIRRSSGWRRLNCSTCIWVWSNIRRIYTGPQETRLYCVHTYPNNNDELRRLLGDVTYLSRFSEDFSTKSEPLRAQLKNSNAFIWE